MALSSMVALVVFRDLYVDDGGLILDHEVVREAGEWFRCQGWAEGVQGPCRFRRRSAGRLHFQRLKMLSRRATP